LIISHPTKPFRCYLLFNQQAIVQNYNAPPAMPPPPLPQIYVEENATPALQQQQSQVFQHLYS
jgi:hypothetical protein